MADLLVGTHERGRWTLDLKTGEFIKDPSVEQTAERMREEKARLIRLAERERKLQESGYL